ncbi:MAG TPA: protein kinase [Gemmatimonadaceae bacterium]|nr:protein kinase [Gemmatimonadaceae bacterium]
MINLRDQLQTALGPNYSLQVELGGGGMSRVFTATESFLGRTVVIKVLPPDLAATVKVERFRREVKFLARLQHAHIVPLLAAGGTEGLSYYIMPFMEGESLRSRIDNETPMTPAESLRLLREVASALAFAHERGIVHRDIKPDNVLICGGAAMVTDFGVAKAVAMSTGENEVETLTSLGIALGTPAYIAPEQATADPATDHRADIYSFGAMAYELLSGFTPFVARSPQAMLAAHVTQKPMHIRNRNPAISESLADIVMRCLEKQPANRPQSADELMRLLDDVIMAKLDTPRDPSRAVGRPSPADSTSVDETVYRDTTQVSMAAASAPIASPISPSSPVTAATPLQAPPLSARIPLLNSSGRWIIVGVIALLAVIAAIFLWQGRDRTNAPGTVSDAALAPLPEEPRDPKSIGVLPLSNAGGDSTDEYFSAGMTDELASALGRVAGLRVASPTSAQALKGEKIDAREIGRRLNVASLLEGSVRRAGSAVNVRVQLTNTNDGLSLWTGSYQMKPRDVFAVQDSISRGVVEALKIELTRADAVELTRRGTTNFEALDHYQRGRYLVGRNTEPAIRDGLAHYQRALAVDPQYARAWAGIAYAWIALADDFVAPRDAYPAAKTAAIKAISIDPALAEARAALGAVYLWHDWDFQAAERELKEAMRLQPSGVYAYRYYGNLLKATGRFDSALAVIRQAQRREPLSAGRVVSVALMYTTLGREDLAIREAQRALTLDPQYADAFLAIGNALLSEGKPREAIASFRRAPQMGNRMKSAIAMAEATLGNKAGARKLLSELETESRVRYVGPEAIAAVHFSLGDRDAGFEWLDRAFDARSAYLALLKSDRRWDSVREDSRFKELMRRVGV